MAVPTVILIAGADSFGTEGSLKNGLGGPQSALQQLGFTVDEANAAAVVVCTYNDWDAFSGYLNGASNLDLEIKRFIKNGPVVVLAHSFGSVAAVYWNQHYAVKSGIDPSQLQFVLLGNSVRPNNGLCAQWQMYTQPLASSIFPIIDGAREYDKWADSPNLLWSSGYLAAMFNAAQGDQFSYPTIHVTYDHVRLDDPTAAKIVLGNITYLLWKTNDPIPDPQYGRSLIATAYNRIVPAPAW